MTEVQRRPLLRVLPASGLEERQQQCRLSRGVGDGGGALLECRQPHGLGVEQRAVLAEYDELNVERGARAVEEARHRGVGGRRRRRARARSSVSG